MRAIETEYNGYRFRSRLEARWAVFFDTLGIPYEYEPEGFRLSWEESGEVVSRGYLPDFYLPEWDCWVEIKPGNLAEKDNDKWQETSKIVSAFSKEKSIMLISGSPYNYVIIFSSPGRQLEGHFALGKKNDRQVFIVSQADGSSFCFNPANKDKCTVSSDRLLHAYEKASQARFESKKRARQRESIGGDIYSDSVIGWIESISYFDEEDGLSIGTLRTCRTKEIVPLFGSLKNSKAGDRIKVKGFWENHPEYGNRFRVHRFHLFQPALSCAIEEYLCSGLIKCIGRVMARRIVKRFGEKAFDILENDPRQLSEVEGLKRRRIKMMEKVWGEQRIIYDLMLFLQGVDLPPYYAISIFSQYGQSSIEKIKENPYKLATNIYGLGFSDAERVADKLGFSKECEQRIEVGVLAVLFGMKDRGRVRCPTHLLVEECMETLETTRPNVMKALRSLIEDEKVLGDANSNVLYLPS